jgi:DNA-directed RNA polymerase subunit RPC12/RpoP
MVKELSVTKVKCHDCGKWNQVTIEQWRGESEIICKNCGHRIQPKLRLTAKEMRVGISSQRVKEEQ